MRRISENPVTSERLNDIVSGGGSMGELSRFARRTEWRADTRSSRRTQRFLYPHSDDYFSPLKPVFLHDLKSPDVLAAYRPLLVRDGVLGLLDFFFRNPVPPSEDAFLFIHRGLGWVVPPAWRSFVAYYEVVSRRREKFGSAEDRGVHLVPAIIDEHQFSIEEFRTTIAGICSSVDRAVPVHFTPVLGPIIGANPEARDRRSRFFFEISKELQKAFGDRLVFLSLGDLLKLNVSGSLFEAFNQRLFYFSDSAITQHLLASGATPIHPGAEKASSCVGSVELSFNHEYRLYLSDDGASCDRTIATVFEDPVFRSRTRAFRGKRNFTAGAKFCSREIETFAEELVSKRMRA